MTGELKGWISLKPCIQAKPVVWIFFLTFSTLTAKCLLMRKQFFACILAGIFLSGSVIAQNQTEAFCPPPGGGDCILLPDIIAGKKSLNSANGWSEYSQLVTGLNRGLLRIDVATPNVGWGPLEAVSTNNYVCGTDTLFNFFPPPTFLCPDGSYPKRLIKQNVYRVVGGVTSFTPRDAGWMQYHPSHGHIHIEGWGFYSIRLKDPSIADTLQWPTVSKGIKVSFCLIDLTTCSSSLGDCVDANGNVLTNTSFPNYGLGGGYNCGSDRQGISVGKVDIYDRSLDESFVKIPYEACNGNYFIVVQVDPDNHFQEINENNNWLAAQIPFTQQRTANTGPYAYIFSNSGNSVCTGGTMELEASGASSYVWSTGATTQKINITQPGQYWVRATTPCGTTTSDTLVIGQTGTSTIPAVTLNDTVCTGQPATLYASGNAQWYDAPVGGTLVYSGNTFQTTPLNNTITYYVTDQPTILAGNLGPVNSSFAGGGFITSSAQFLVFNAFLPFKLKKVTVNAEVAGIRTIQLRNLYNKVIAQKQVTLVAGTQEIDLDFDVPAGMNHQLGLSSGSMARLYMNSTTNPNIGFPFKVKSVANIIGSSLGDGAYPFFYNWKIETYLPACAVQLRKAVTALVVPRPTVLLSGLQSVYLHTDSPVQLSGSPVGGSFSGTGVIGSKFYPRVSGVGTFNIEYNYNHPVCPDRDTKSVTVKFNDDVMADGFDIKVFNTPGSSPRLQVTSRENSPITVRVISSIGQIVQQYSFSSSAGTNMYNLNLDKPARAIYTVEVYHAVSGKRKMARLVN